MEGERKRLYVCCPGCSRRLCTAKENSDLEIECPKCGKVINILFSSERKVITEIVKEQQKN